MGDSFKMSIKNEEALLQKVQALIDDPSDLLEALGQDAVAFSQDSFENQRLGKGPKWRERDVPNLAGIFADANAGRASPSRRFDKRPALIDTGRLRNSIKFSLAGKNKITFGSNLPYASKHQNGELSVQNKTNPLFDQHINTFIKRNKSKLDKEGRAKVENLKSISQLFRKMPVREFVGYTDERANEVIEDFLEIFFS